MYTNTFINNLKKIELKKNNKKPVTKWSNVKNHVTIVDLKKYNVGFPTGKLNNIIVLDIDFKDEGIEEFDKYKQLYGDINTFIVKTPNKGFHYYFLYEHTDEETQHLINECLTNKAKYRGSGIDIRTNGGYIVAPKSSINKVYYEIINDVKPIEMPETLILWLLENDDNNDKDNENNIKNENKIKKVKNVKKTIIKTTKLTYKNYSTKKYIYVITDEELVILLNKLDKTYLSDYTKWLIVLTILKNLDKWNIFDTWCKKHPDNYDYEQNLKMWNCNKGLIDINYLIKRINKEQKTNIKLVERYKPIDKTINSLVEKIKITEEKLKFDDKLINENNVLIVDSDTGTGKTTHISKQIKKYIDDTKNKYQLVSIVNLINLANQQTKSFNDQKLPLVSYKDSNKKFYKDHIVICINSLILLKYMDDDYFKNKILYLDEINSLLEGLSHNPKLTPNIKIIYEILIKFIKNSHKIIMSDATIKQNVFDLLKKSRQDNEIKYIINEFKKYQGTNAVRVLDENLFLTKLQDRIKNNKYFLFGCDSCTVITKLYNICVEKNKTKEKDFILITSEHPFLLVNATEQFKNKWVFYEIK